MSSIPLNDSPSDGSSPLVARVVLVGRTGLDAALRLDPGIELLRAKNAIDAIGELASPIDNSTPLDTTVIVAAEADPGAVSNHGSAPFIDGLRAINPDVRVLLVGTGKRGAYDGVILSPLVPHESLRAMVRRNAQTAPSEPDERPGAAPSAQVPEESEPRFVRPPPPPTPPEPLLEPTTPAPAEPPAAPAAPEPTPPPEPAQAAAPTPAPSAPIPTVTSSVILPTATVIISPAAGAAPPPVEPPTTPMPPAPTRTTPPADLADSAADESTLLEAMLTGRDPLLPALEILRRRTGLADLAYADSAIPFTAPTSQPAPTAPPPPRITIPVVHRTRTFGFLTTAALADPAAIAPHAQWLADWLALREQHDQLREAAFTDDLTGSHNRRYFDRFLAAALDRARADRLTVTVLFFDIDDFKQYNDRHGHVAGDEILRETVRLLKSVIRPTDRVCRIGGDEFAVVFYEPAGPRDPTSRPPSSIMEIAQRFQRQICEHRFPKLAEQAPGTLTISGGLATFPWDGTTPQELVERADALAIESKRKGKNVITLGPGAEKVCRV